MSHEGDDQAGDDEAAPPAYQSSHGDLYLPFPTVQAEVEIRVQESHLASTFSKICESHAEIQISTVVHLVAIRIFGRQRSWGHQPSTQGHRIRPF